jgi:cell division septation protein DedD
MKDDQASEENLMGELDRMYKHVADIESCQAQVEHNHNPNEPEQISDEAVPTRAKIIPFPGHRIHLPSGEESDASEEESRRKRKPSYRPYLIVASFSLIFLVFVLVIIPLKGMMAPPGSEKGEPHQLTSPIYSTRSPAVQTQEDVLQNIERRQQKAKTMPHQTFGSNSPFTQNKHYAVQVGAFRNWGNASQRIDALREKDLEPYWVEIQSKSRRIVYIVFSGYFADRNEATEFLKRQGILKNYPDSYVREISFQKK